MVLTSVVHLFQERINLNTDTYRYYEEISVTYRGHRYLRQSLLLSAFWIWEAFQVSLKYTMRSRTRFDLKQLTIIGYRRLFPFAALYPKVCS